MRATGILATPKSQALFLCRTPLQARICLEILQVQRPRSFDLIYLTQDDSEADHTYFGRLATQATHAEYIHIPRQRPDILNHLRAIQRSPRWSREGYGEIYLASFDSLAFQRIVKANPGADLHSYDDGTANINLTGGYHDFSRYKKALVYSAMLRLPNPSRIKRDVKRHFSIYPGFDNIVPSGKITFLNPFRARAEGGSGRGPTFYIGQPVTNDIPAEDVRRLSLWLRRQHVDFYVMHPREKKPLVDTFPFLDKGGEIAEDAIFAAANGKRPAIIAPFSTVLFNVSRASADKTYLSFISDPSERSRRVLAERAGATVIDLQSLNDDGMTAPTAPIRHKP